MIELPTVDRPGVLAELGQTGGDDIGYYVDAVDAFAEAGAFGVKVQMIEPGLLAGRDAVPYWQTTRYADTQAESFRLAGCVPHDGWGPVRERCAERDVAFVATPFDLGAVSPLLDLEPDAVKLASGDITYRALVETVALSFSQVIVSTGAADEAEVRRAVRWVRMGRTIDGPADGVCLLACSLAYPTPPEQANLARIGRLADLHGGTVGYSDHTVQSSAAEAGLMGVAVVTAGAALAEKHCALDSALGAVPDLDMAATPSHIAGYAAGMTWAAGLRGTGSLEPHDGELAAREGARRGLIVTRDVPAGDVLGDDDLVAVRPCPPSAMEPDTATHIAGRVMASTVRAGRVVDWQFARRQNGETDRPLLVTTEPVA